MSVSLLFCHRQGPPRFLVTFLLSMVLSTLGLSAFAQGHPELKEEDFGVSFIVGNQNCDTPGILSITYANRVAGFTKLSYEVVVYDYRTNQNVTIKAATTDLGKTLLIPFTEAKEPETRGIHIKVQAEYGGSTPEEVELYHTDYSGGRTDIVYSSPNTISGAMVGGECSGVGEISLPTAPLTGIREMIYEIYKEDGTLLTTHTLTNPYLGEKVTVAAPAVYNVKPIAVLDCSNPTKENDYTGYGDWDGNKFVYNMQEVSLAGEMSVSANASAAAMGDCEGEATLAAYGTGTATAMTYEIRKSGETAVFKTVTSSTPTNFEVKVKLPAGNYEVTGISNSCGNKVKTSLNLAKSGLNPPTVTAVGRANVGCPDGVITAQVYGVPDDVTITYELIERDSNTLVQTKTGQGSAKVTFNNIVLPDNGSSYVYYKVNAKTCGVSSSKETYARNNGTPSLYLNNRDYGHIGCSDGSIEAMLYNVSNDLDVTYVLSHKGTVLATKTAKGGEQVKFENIFVYEDANNNDAYTVEAQVCSLRKKETTGIRTNSYPETRIQEQTGPSSICVADGTITVTNYSGSYYFGNLQGQLEVYANDVLIHSENVDGNWISSTITGVPAGQITAKLNFGCGTTPETKFVLKPRTLYAMNLSVYARMTSYCVDQQMRIEPILEFPRATSGYPPALDMLEEMKQGTYELYKGTTLLSSGNYSDIPEAGLPVTEEGDDYRLVVRSRCTPSVVLTVPNIKVKKPVLSFYEAKAYDSSGCIPTGSISIRMTEGYALPEKISSLEGYFSYELMKDGVLYRSGQITAYGQQLSIAELPPARYTLNVFITCAPEMSISTELEVKGKLEVPTLTSNSVSIQPACGSLLSDVYISLPRPTTDIKSYDVVLTRKSDNQVVYKNHITGSSIYRQLLAGEYRLTYVMNSQCNYPEATYDFTVGATSDLSEAYKFEVSTIPPTTLNGLGRASIELRSKALYYSEKIKDLITLTLTSTDGKTYSRIVPAGSSFQFYNLPAGTYTAKASFVGRNCEKTITFLMPSPGLKGYNYPDMECGSNSPLGLGVALETANADFKGKVFTFKLYKRTAPGASTFTQVASKTETAGKTWTYFPGVLSGTDYSLYEAVVEMDGYEVYREEVEKPRQIHLYDLTATSTPTQKYNNVDYKLGTVTAVLPPNSRYYKSYAMPFGGTHTWELTHSGTGETYTKTASSPLTPVTFDNLPEGTYRIAYSYANGTCAKTEYYYTNVTVTSSTPFVLMTSAVNATCELNAKITAEVRDAAGIQMLTYTLTSPANSYNESQNTTTPAVPMTFPDLAPGEYTLRAEAQLMGGGAPLVQTQTITLTGTSPMMNIVIDPKRTRPALKGCATGYFAFKFVDDDEYTPKTIGEEYEFSIVEAPVGSGISVPMKLVRGNTTWTSPYYTNTNNLSQRMNFPAGKYKFKVKNDCKTLEFEYTLLERDENPYRYGAISYQCETDGVYRIYGGGASLNNSNDDYIYWDDLFRLSVTSASGVTMPPAPFSEFAGKVLPFEPQEHTTKVTSICPSIPAADRSWSIGVSYGTRQECDYTEVTGDEGTACEQRILLVEDLDAPVGSQILHRGPFYGYYKAQGNRRFRFTILNQNNKTLWTETMTPKNFGTVTWGAASDICDTRQVSCYIYGGCGKAYFKIYKGIGAAKEAQPVYESKELETRARYTGPLFQDYTFEAYDHNNVLIYSSTGNSGGYTHITEFGIYNACGYNTTDADDEYKMQTVAFKVPPLAPRTNMYYLPPTTFTIVKGDKTYVGTLHPNYAHKSYYTYWLPAVGEWSYAPVTWKVIRYNTTNAGAHGPTFKFGETISGTYSVCDGPEKPFQGVTQPNKIFKVELLDGWTQTCDGWDLVVPSKAYYTVNDKKQEVTVTGYEYTNPVTNVKYASSTLDGAVLKVPIGQKFGITLKGLPCGFTSVYRPNRMEHTIDKAKSLSFYCTANHMGKHYVEAKNGTPPYTYTFYDGTGPTASPIPSTATSPNPQTSMTGAMFDWGEDGKTYRIDVKDACGNVTISQETTVLSMTNLMQRLKQDITTCSGEAVTFLGQSFPVAIYNWTLPAGSPRVLTPAEKSSRILTLNNIQPSDAGTYTLDISPNDCSVNIQMTFELSVDHVAPITTPAVNSIVCKGTPVPLSPGAGSADSNGTPGAVTYQWYHSRDGINFTKITGETTDSYTYPANTVGRMHIKRVDSYKNCSKETPVNIIEVKETPIQTFTTKELGLSTRNGKKFTLPTGRVVPSTGVTYQWERSDDGVSGWTPVSTDRQFEETTTFPKSQKQVFYRRKVIMGNCSVMSPNIRVRFSSSTPMINPHLRLRVKN